MNKCTAKTLLKTPGISERLVEVFDRIPDKRSDQGKRFSLALILCIVLFGFMKGKKSVEGCANFARVYKKWFALLFDLPYGIPVATTITRALAVTLPQDVIRFVKYFVRSLDGVVIERGMSIDGKTIKAISELKRGCKHFISLFTHTTCRILDQEGVASKENEITATPRLMERNNCFHSMITADALLTQTKITQAIREVHADYLLIVKDNHPDLQDILVPTFTDPLTNTTTAVFREKRRTRRMTTTMTLTSDLDLHDLHTHGWVDIAVVGKLERTGKRLNKGNLTTLNEIVFFITSRKDLTPGQAYEFLRNHWHIENKLHWQKDMTWAEDRSRARVGNTPSILSYLRSFALECIKRQYQSVTKAIEEFTEQPHIFFALLTKLQIV
jgi:predicted transposase YbfD/YdcC